jgi:Domain of unknown function (DUF6265)
MRPHVLVTLSCLSSTLSLSPAHAADACSMQSLRFMEGVWQSEEGDTRGEERWSLTSANTLAGSAWEAKGAVLGFAEALSILPQDGTIQMRLRHFDGGLQHAWEEKDSPMIFQLARCDTSSAVFDGTGEKAGEHITYRRSGDDLNFIGDFLRNGKPFRVELRMRRAAGSAS